jgi:Flp pilus assembly protein TadG
MRVRSHDHLRRRGVTAAECGIVYSITVLLIMGTMVVGLGVFRYEQISHLAREGARYATVHGPTYQQEQNQPAPTSQDVLNNAVIPMAVGLDTTQLDCTLTMTSSVATVTLTYDWQPEMGLFSPITFTSKAVVPITY